VAPLRIHRLWPLRHRSAQTPSPLWAHGWNEITHCLFWSLTANLLSFLTVSSLRSPNAVEAAQASAYVDAFKHGRPAGLPIWRGSAEIAELMALAERFLGAERTRRAFEGFARSRGAAAPENLPADAQTVHFAETLLSGAIGGASARVMVASVTEEEALGIDEVLNILDEASQIRAYSRELEQKSRELEAATAELRAANLRLQELDRLKDDFMSSVTHELRTPLASIRAFSEILHDDPDIEIGERKRFLGILVSETERLSRLVNQVLDLAKIESGHADWLIEAVDLKEVIEQSVAATGQLIAGRGRSFRWTWMASGMRAPPWSWRTATDWSRSWSTCSRMPPSSPRARTAGRGPSGPAGQAPAGLRSRQRPRHPDDELDLVFEKFLQASSSGEKPVGTGLGLPISRQIVENFGGRIWAEGGVGKGATLCFELPALAPEPPSPPVNPIHDYTRPDRRRRAQHRHLAGISAQTRGLRGERGAGR